MHDDEFVFKLTNYVNIPTASQSSFHSKQLGYVTPELLSTGAFHVKSNKASDIYAFAILSYAIHLHGMMCLLHRLKSLTRLTSSIPL